MPPNAFQSAIAAAIRTNRSIAGVPVTYSRTAGSVVLTVTPGRSESEATDDQGSATRVRSRDYLIDAATLVIGGSAVEPRPGDRITEGSTTAGGSVYEVDNMPGEPCWRWSDTGRTTYRVHTKYIGLTPIN